MKSDEDIQAHVKSLLATIPSVNPDHVSVQVDDAVVTLTGTVDSHQTRFQVERAVARVPGTKGMVTRIAPHRPILRLPRKSG